MTTPGVWQYLSEDIRSRQAKKYPSHEKSTEILLKKDTHLTKKNTENFSKTTHV